MLIQHASMHVQHMQKALTLMNIPLANVIRDVTGETGMRIIRAIASGERNADILASYRDRRCKNSVETIKKSLVAHYKNEQVFALKQALELYDFYHQKITECEQKIEAHLLTFVPRIEADEPSFDVIEQPTTLKKNLAVDRCAKGGDSLRS